MMKKTKSTNQILAALLSGRHPQAKKLAGKHVLVVKDQIVPMKSGKGALKDINSLEKKYGETPTLIFVPRQNVSYILILCLK